MNGVAAKRPGAPSGPIRASSLVLAALASGIPLFLLILGLSIKSYQAAREARIEVDLIPLPATPPPPEPARPSPAKPADHEAAPAPAAPRPATLVVQSTPIVPQPPPQPLAADISGNGTGTTPGTGTGGTGIGGNGNGPVGGTLVRASPPVRTDATWVFKPGTPELRPYNPPAARRESVNGRVVLRCHVLRTGRVTGCKIASEGPRGYGFGRAALAASQIFLLKPPTLNGEPDEARLVEIPVAFNNR